MSAANCEAGDRLAERLGLGAGVRAALNEVHERWDGKGMPNQCSGEQLIIASRIGVFCYDVTVHRQHALRSEVCAMVRQRAGGEHDPGVCALFLRDAEQFFDAIESESVWDATLQAEPEPRPWLPEGRLD